MLRSMIDRKKIAQERNAAIDTIDNLRQKLDFVWLDLKDSKYRQISEVDEVFGKICAAIDLLDESVDELFREHDQSFDMVDFARKIVGL